MQDTLMVISAQRLSAWVKYWYLFSSRDKETKERVTCPVIFCLSGIAVIALLRSCSELFLVHQDLQV